MRKPTSKHIQAFFLLAIFLSVGLMFGGCEGPMGPSGKDVEGVDTIPPTVVLSNPSPLSDVWDSFTMSASAVDNVDIREISLLVDGTNYYNGQSLVFYEPPYEIDLDIDSTDTGWHFLSARGFDTAGNATETAPVPVYFGFANDLQDTVVVKSYFSPDSSNIMSWNLPDSSHALSYYSSFSIARSCRLLSCSVMLAGATSDTDSVAIGVWIGDDIPETKQSEALIPGSALTDSLTWHTIEFEDDGLRVTSDFYIMVSIHDGGEADTVALGSDNGIPFYNRSGSMDETGYDTLKGRYARKNNFLISCELYYEPLQEEQDNE